MFASDLPRRVLAIGALLVALFCLETASFPFFGPVHTGDETVWWAVAQAPLASLDFYTGTRPFTVPLLHKLLGGQQVSVVLAQSLLSVACWSVLALSLAREFQPGPARVAAAVLVALFSLTIPVNQWDVVIRSESLFFSAMALSLAVALELVRAARRRVGLPLLGIFAAACALFVGTRESALYLLAGLMAWLVAWLCLTRVPRLAAAAPRDRVRTAAAVALLAAITALAQASTAHSMRWHTPLVNVLLARVVTDPATLSWWQREYGLPRDTALTRYAGRRAWDASENGVPIRERLARDASFAADQQWILERGMASYRRYLLRDALVPSLATSFTTLASAVNFTNRYAADGAGRTGWTETLTSLLYPRIPRAGAVCLLLALLGPALAARHPSAARLGLACGFLAFSAWVQAFVNYHGDSDGIARHLAPAGVLVHLALLVLLLAVLRAAAEAASAASPSASSAQ